MGDVTEDMAHVIAPCELPGYASVLRVPDGSGGWVSVPLRVAEHRAIAERMVAMLGVEIGPLVSSDEDGCALCERCGAYRPRWQLVASSFPADRPGVGVMETRWICVASCDLPGGEVAV
ncbi:hypothetical protein LO772_20760 [Yinghuangia sp. ASG 101]|uniref:hypothetical protein n=1 Tax=Yinghuangia sp. ASG 101 TaxID=2896848 RepID=UPI001E3E8033|nr:hypothetical protein [Yinghuangia sp. ASG 101]UGQ09366.1 hypothetical protein LO772_20760 [Yinghuangia sp. ASG 101]